MVDIYCPHCNVELEIIAKSGDTVQCAECERPFVVTNKLIKEYADAQPESQVQKKTKKAGDISGGLFIAVVLGMFVVSVMSDKEEPKIQNAEASAPKIARSYMEENAYKVAADYIEKYEIALIQGDEMQICVQAGLVSAAFLNAKDQEQYNKWKSIEANRCQEAGISR